MSSYFRTLLTTTTSRYAALQSLLPGNSEQDGDTEDDTHICRVLRAYYVEKGRPFPGWLPPDPKAPQPVVQPVYTPNAPVGAGYGGLQAGGGQSKLGSLWDAQPAPQQPTGPQSLRQGGRGVQSSVLSGNRSNPYTRSQSSPNNPESVVQARPLPSQRAGSVQNPSRVDTPPGSSGSGSTVGASTAQDRLKARLWGAAKASAQGQGQAPQQSRTSPAPTGYERSGNSGGYGGGGAYDDRSRSMGSSWSGSGGGDGRSGGGGYTDRPFVAATAPWASNEDEFIGGGYGSGGVRNGLPSGPGAGRRPGGGPRGMR
jgi:hypothetical protein